MSGGQGVATLLKKVSELPFSPLISPKNSDKRLFTKIQKYEKKKIISRI